MSAGQGCPYGRGARKRHAPPLENVKNLGKLFNMIRKYLFK
jgi:hypothetical protein